MKKQCRKSNKRLNIFDTGGTETNANSGINASSMLSTAGGLLGGAISQIPNVNAGQIDNEVINDAVYGNSKQDPLVRMFRDLSGKSTEDAVKQLSTRNQMTDFKDSNDLMASWNKLNFNDTLNTHEGAEWKTALSTALGAPYLDFKDNKVQFSGDNLIASAQGASYGANFGPWGALIGGALGGTANLISRFGRNKRIEKINKAIEKQNEFNMSSFLNKANNLTNTNYFDNLANYSAYGGPIFNRSNLVNNYDSLYMNTFGNGGNLHTNGTDWNTDLTLFNEGGKHEDNPLQGIPISIDPEGNPNLVEEGEVKYKDYIFSNRLHANESLLEKYGLPKNQKNNSFALIAEKLSKEYKERPNDPISKRGLEDTMSKLQSAQEELKYMQALQSEKSNPTGNIFWKGGDIIDYTKPWYTNTWDEKDSIDYFNSLNNKKYAGFYKSSPVEDTFDIPLEQLPTNKDNEISLGKKIDIPQSSNSYKKRGFDESYLRYVPALGAGIGVITDLAGLTNKPDYSYLDLIRDYNTKDKKVNFKPIGNYLTYNPLDRNYYLNKLNAQAESTRRAINNQSGGNRANAIAGLLAADYNAQNNFGNLVRQAEELNFARKAQVEDFNRNTNMFNSEGLLKADMVSRQGDKFKLSALLQAAKLKNEMDAAASAGRSANLTNLFDSIGNIGWEAYNRNMINSNNNMYYEIDRTGKVRYKRAYWDLEPKERAKIRKRYGLID